MSTKVDTSRSRWRATSISGLWPDTLSATRCAQSRLASGGMAVVKLVATLSSSGRRAVVLGGVADRYAGKLARAGQSNRQRAGTGSAAPQRATRPPLWPAGMAQGNRATFGPRVGLSSHGSPAKGGPKSKCLARVKIARTSAGPPSFGPVPLPAQSVPLSPICPAFANLSRFRQSVPLSPICPAFANLSRFRQSVPLSPICPAFPNIVPLLSGPVPLCPAFIVPLCPAFIRTCPVPLSPIPAFPNRTPVYPDLSRFRFRRGTRHPGSAPIADVALGRG